MPQRPMREIHFAKTAFKEQCVFIRNFNYNAKTLYMQIKNIHHIVLQLNAGRRSNTINLYFHCTRTKDEQINQKLVTWLQ